VKPSGGSRGDPADAPGAQDVEADEERSARGDPELRAMRTVWLQMRDEEPSGRGLAELLVAARDKASAMQPRPSWWQRVLAGLRRPPVVLPWAILLGRIEAPLRLGR